MATFNYTLPVVGGNQNSWGDILNQNWTNFGTFIGNIDSTEIATLSGVSSNIQTQIDTKSPKESPVFTGAVEAGDKIVLGSWEIWDDGGTLYFRHGTNNVFKIDSSGNITAASNVTAYGSV